MTQAYAVGLDRNAANPMAGAVLNTHVRRAHRLRDADQRAA